MNITKPNGCNVPECWHYIALYPGTKCLCSNPRDDRTGEPGCPGYKERKVV